MPPTRYCTSTTEGVHRQKFSLFTSYVLVHGALDICIYFIPTAVQPIQFYPSHYVVAVGQKLVLPSLSFSSVRFRLFSPILIPSCPYR
jgi:hypothetical protein